MGKVEIDRLEKYELLNYFYMDKINMKRLMLNCHEYIKVITKSYNDYLLISWWSIFDPKSHNNPYKNPSINNKGGLLLVF
jgi:hypothetical protein